MLKIVASGTLGFLFGWAMEKAKVYEPIAIRDQMTFKRFIMIKMFFGALAASTISIILLKKFFKKQYASIYEGYRDSLKNKSYFLLITGGALIGFGMQISGACPGMVLVQVGAGVPSALITLLGALTGALVHGLLNSHIMSISKPNLELSKSAFELLNASADKSRALVALTLSASVILLEYLIPWTNEYPNALADKFLLYKAWQPALSGAIIGSLQFFNILLVQKSLGASSCYSTIVGLPFTSESLAKKFPYLAKFGSGLPNWLGVLFISGAILGGYVSSTTSGVYGKSVGIDSYQAFLGGFLMVFGARIAGGCTSGHGISGSSYQFAGSLLTTATMFMSAIGLGMLRRH